jgi:AcrR family transcriptional regulator
VPRRSFLLLPEQRRTAILEIAADEFAKHGFRNTSYNQLLARAGLGKGSAYHYFEDKRDLFLTVASACYTRFFDGLAAVPAPASAEEFWVYVERINLLGLEFMQRDPTSAKVLRAVRDERVLGEVLASAELSLSLEAHYIELVKLGQALGAVRDDVPFQLIVELAQALSSTFDTWFVANAFEAGEAKLETYARTFTRLTYDLFSGSSAEPAPRPQRSERKPLRQGELRRRAR